jgi:hypothetical protein
MTFSKRLASGRSSLLRRILHANLLVGGVAVCSLTALFLTGYRSEFQRQQTLRAEMLARLVARQSEVPALIGDRGALEKIAAQAAGGEDVVFVRIACRPCQKDIVAGVPVRGWDIPEVSSQYFGVWTPGNRAISGPNRVPTRRNVSCLVTHREREEALRSFGGNAT